MYNEIDTSTLNNPVNNFPVSVVNNAIIYK